MINIRYHIVSITAVFLALGIGVALGSTFLDGATVTLLNRNIRDAEVRIDAANATNAQLRRAQDDAKERDRALIDDASEDLVANHLTDIPLVIVAAPGIDKDKVEDLRTVLARTGADFRGTIELADRLSFDGELDTDLAADLDLVDPTSVQLRSEVNTQLNKALAAAGRPSTGSGDDLGQPEIVTTLLDHGYLSIDPAEGGEESDPILEVRGYRYVFMGQPGLESTQNSILLSLLPVDEDADPLPAVVVSATIPVPKGDEPEQESVVTTIRDTDVLAQLYSTVDNADTFAGLVSTVYVTQQIEDLVPGHFGQDDGATAVMPPVP